MPPLNIIVSLHSRLFSVLDRVYSDIIDLPNLLLMDLSEKGGGDVWMLAGSIFLQQSEQSAKTQMAQGSFLFPPPLAGLQ